MIPTPIANCESSLLTQVAVRGYSADVSDEHNPKPPFCDCDDWEVCGCGNQPPYHCPWCCHDLSPERLGSWDWEKWRRKRLNKCNRDFATTTYPRFRQSRPLYVVDQLVQNELTPAPVLLRSLLSAPPTCEPSRFCTQSFTRPHDKVRQGTVATYCRLLWGLHTGRDPIRVV